jgi:hypothetical protein
LRVVFDDVAIVVRRAWHADLRVLDRNLNAVYTMRRRRLRKPHTSIHRGAKRDGVRLARERDGLLRRLFGHERGFVAFAARLLRRPARPRHVVLVCHMARSLSGAMRA